LRQADMSDIIRHCGSHSPHNSSLLCFSCVVMTKYQWRWEFPNFSWQ